MRRSRDRAAIGMALLAGWAGLVLGACGASPEPVTQPSNIPPGDSATAAPRRAGPGAAEPGTTVGPSAPGDRPAVPGVGRKGQDYGLGPVSTPVRAMWTTQQRLALLQLAGPMNLYHAEHGHFPKTEREFFEKIVRANSIRLPELPDGRRWVYDAQRAARMTQYDPEDPPLRVVPVDSAAGEATP